MTNRRQAGEGVAGCVVYLLLAAIAALVLVKMVPVKFKTSEFNDYMVEQAKFAGRRTTAQGVHGAILRQGRKSSASPSPRRTSRWISRAATSTCAAVTPCPSISSFFTYEWDFDHQVRRPVFII